MNLTSITKPEYYLRPKQVLKRIFKNNAQNNSIFQELPSGLEIQVSLSDELGRSICSSGIYDLCLTEALWRLTKAGSFCIDIGANIGYATSIMAKRAGTGGTVTAFEPHPDIFEELTNNINTWNKSGVTAPINCVKKGLSDFNGERSLFIPPAFVTNRGMAHFYEESEKPGDSGTELLVPCIKLDDYAVEKNIKYIDILKVDAEGHEIQVLKGAINLLSEKRLGNIIFEDSRGSWRTPKELYDDYKFLNEMGYTIFRLRRGIFGPNYELLEDIKYDAKSLWKSWEPPNFIATLDEAYIRETFSKIGWYSILNRDFK